MVAVPTPVRRTVLIRDALELRLRGRSAVVVGKSGIRPTGTATARRYWKIVQ